MKAAIVDSGIRPAVLGVKEAAAYVGVAVTTLYRMMGRREVPFLKVGKRTLIRVADLDSFLAGQVGASALLPPVRQA